MKRVFLFAFSPLSIAHQESGLIAQLENMTYPSEQNSST